MVTNLSMRKNAQIHVVNKKNGLQIIYFYIVGIHDGRVKGRDYAGLPQANERGSRKVSGIHCTGKEQEEKKLCCCRKVNQKGKGKA